MILGVEGYKMVYGCIFYLEIRDDKIWIYCDGIEDGIVRELLVEGVFKDKIVLGFYIFEKCKIIDFVVC